MGVARWDNAGTEPSEGKKTAGWLEGEKPAADWFNWLFNQIFARGITKSIFTSTGSFTVPLTGKYKVTCVGGGAGSDYANASAGVYDYHMGGGGGAAVIKYLTLTRGDVYTATVGAAGVKGVHSGQAVTNGGTTSFGALVSANGGQYSGVGGVASGGDVNINGQNANGGGMYSSYSIYVNNGGGSQFGAGGIGACQCLYGVGQGKVGTGFGAGAGGSAVAGASYQDGQDGTKGICIIEYIG
jgi:hypothetical protein